MALPGHSDALSCLPDEPTWQGRGYKGISIGRVLCLGRSGAGGRLGAFGVDGFNPLAAGAFQLNDGMDMGEPYTKLTSRYTTNEDSSISLHI